MRYLRENGVTIWDEWADEHGDLGPIYGKPVALMAGAGRRARIDQLSEVVGADRQATLTPGA